VHYLYNKVFGTVVSLICIRYAPWSNSRLRQLRS